MSKSDQIKLLLEAGYSVGGIAGLLGTREEYVRAVKQRMRPGGSAADNKYEAMRRKRYWSDPDYRTMMLERHRGYRDRAARRKRAAKTQPVDKSPATTSI